MPKKIFVPAGELFNEQTGEFIYTKDTYLILEHSLISLSKWESKWRKPFLVKDKKTYEETLSYIKCMTLNNVDDNVYLVLPDNVIREINEYVETDQTATWFSEETSLNGKSKSKETVTSELIYYWMVALQIPPSFEKWHLSRLITLIKICNIKNAPKKKTSKRELINRYKNINEQRRAMFNSKG